MVMVVMAMGQRSHTGHDPRAVEVWLSICFWGHAAISSNSQQGDSAGYVLGEARNVPVSLRLQ